MYESPIDIIYGEMETQIENDVLKAVQRVGVNVNKEELLKALQYDREQYSKGYNDGLNADRWISCSERLPEETDYPEQRYRILASCSDGIVRNATIKSLRDPEEKHRSMGNEFTYVAWMPLPEPYKGE
jgi:hypothetical protein